jgi:hypothetical protein
VSVSVSGSLGFIGFGGADAANDGCYWHLVLFLLPDGDLLLPLLPLECDSLWNYATIWVPEERDRLPSKRVVLVRHSIQARESKMTVVAVIVICCYGW